MRFPGQAIVVRERSLFALSGSTDNFPLSLCQEEMLLERLHLALSAWRFLFSVFGPYGIALTARAATMTSVNSEIVLSSIISIFARLVSGSTSVGLNAVAVLYPRER